MGMPTVSIIVVAYNSARYIRDCLKSLLALDYRPIPQIVVVDNGSTDGSANIAALVAPHIRILEQGHNSGFGPAVNRGVMTSSGEYIALLNPDTVVDPSWLTNLIKALRDPGVGLAGSKILSMDGSVLHHTGGTVLAPLMLTTHRGHGERDKGQYDKPADMPFLTGAALAMQRDLWTRLGGFDEGFFPGYFEDTDLCLRVRLHGLTCRYVPSSVVRHVESASTRKFSGSYYYYFHRNRLRFAAKELSLSELWSDFCPAEAQRLTETSDLDRAIAMHVYRRSLPHGLHPPTESEQQLILATGATLGTISPDDANAPEKWPEAAKELLGGFVQQQAETRNYIAELQASAVLHEHVFLSQLGPVAAFRRWWNGLSTRWYVLPVLERQTKANLAMARALATLDKRVAADETTLLTVVRQAVFCIHLAKYGQDGVEEARSLSSHSSASK